MSQSIKQHAFGVQSNILQHIEGLRTLSGLVEFSGHHGGDTLQTPAEFCIGLAALVNATADSLHAHCHQLEALEASIAELEKRPTVANLQDDKDRYLMDVLAHYGLTVQDLKDLKAGLMVLSPPIAPLSTHATLSSSEHGPAATQ